MKLVEIDTNKGEVSLDMNSIESIKTITPNNRLLTVVTMKSGEQFHTHEAYRQLVNSIKKFVIEMGGE